MTYLVVWPNSLEGFVKTVKLIVCVETPMGSIPEKTQMFTVSGQTIRTFYSDDQTRFRLFVVLNVSLNQGESGDLDGGRLLLNVLWAAGRAFISSSVLMCSPAVRPTHARDRWKLPSVLDATNTDYFCHVLKYPKYKMHVFNWGCNGRQIRIVCFCTSFLVSLLFSFIYSSIG